MTATDRQLGQAVGAPGEGFDSPLAGAAGAGAPTAGPACHGEDASRSRAVTKAYVFTRRWVDPRSVTPPADIEAAAERIARTWNDSIGRNRVRILTTPRMIEICAVLAVFTPDQVCAAIEFYGRQKWQRVSGKWKRFDNWMTVPVVTQWVEAEADAREDAAKRQQYSARVARQQRETAQAKRDEQDAQLARRKRFRSLPAARQKELKLLAQKRLGDDGKPAGFFTNFVLEMAAITIMDEAPTQKATAEAAETAEEKANTDSTERTRRPMDI